MKHAAAATFPGAVAPRRRGGWRSHLPFVSQYAVDHLLVLPLGALIAIAWVNLAPESYYIFALRAAFPVNEIGMALFLGLMTKEIVEATAPGGTLQSWRRATLPVVAGLAGAAAAGLTFAWVTQLVDQPMLAVAWPSALGVDIALVYFVARATLGRHPAVPFLLVLAVTSNVVGFIAVAGAAQGATRYPVGALAGVAAAAWLARTMSHARVRSHWAYLAGPAMLSWLALYFSGFPPALALLPIVPFMRHARTDPGLFEDAPPRAHDTLSEFEHVWKYPVQVAVFAFALVNAGVQLRGLETGAWAVPAAAIVAKPAAILLACGIALLAGLRLPAGVRWRELVVISVLGGVGFTFALFFAAEVLPPGEFLRETKAGILLTLVLIPLAAGLAYVVGAGRPAKRA